VQEQIRRAMEQVRETMEKYRGPASGKAPKNAWSAPPLPPLPPTPPTPRVTVRSSANSVQSLVHADDTGTYVLVRNPRLRLTAHDREGELWFDGEIETEAQRAEVPAEVWKRVEPLLDRMTADEAQLPSPPTPPAPPAVPRPPVPEAF
jgi:hypothetical protein